MATPRYLGSSIDGVPAGFNLEAEWRFQNRVSKILRWAGWFLTGRVVLHVAIGIVWWALAAEVEGRGLIVAWTVGAMVKEGIPAVLAFRFSTLRGHVATAITWFVIWPPLVVLVLVVLVLAMALNGAPAAITPVVAGDLALMVTVQGFPIVTPMALWFRAYSWKRRLQTEASWGRATPVPYAP